MKKIYSAVFILVLMAQSFMAILQEGKLIVQIDNKPITVIITKCLVAGTFPSEYYPASSENPSLRDGYSIDFLKEIGGETNPKIGEGTAVNLPNGNQVKFNLKEWNYTYVDIHF